MLGGVPAGPAGAGGTLADVVGDLHARLIRWTARQALAATSVTGISLALGICAAAWFSAGSRAAELNGCLALSASYLAAFAAREIAGEAARGRGRAAWVVTLGTRLCDIAALAGLALGALAEGWPGLWPLAVTVLALVAVRETMTACSGPVRFGDSPAGRAAAAALAMPAGGRVLLIVATAPIWGPRASLLVLLDWGIIAVGYGIGSGTAARRRDRRAPRERPERSEPGGLAVLLQPARPPERAEAKAGPAGQQPIHVLRMELAPPPRGLSLGDLAPAGDLASPADTGAAASPAGGEPGPAAAAAAAQRQAMVLRCRDDGAIARWLGALVRGQLMPLPPALLALAAVAMMAHLGLRDLPGLLILAPALIMLVAAPGSSHPHGGRLDWLAPAVLQAAQYTYIWALGTAAGVPGPVVFALCAVIAVHYADLSSASSPVLPASRRAWPLLARMTPGRGACERGAWLGWDGRMIICGLGAAMGIAVFAYLAVAAYLGVLICWKFMTSSHGVAEGDRR
ncbi:MAG TPA: DUF5941 domain-containing protein [Streptosporangiaceae bacterium]|nr:DUF5941 domain-containing protein [Streptosporangiaceae bacterium]